MRNFLMGSAAIVISLAVAAPAFARHHHTKHRMHSRAAQIQMPAKQRADQPLRGGGVPSRENEVIQDSWTRLSPCCPP